VRLLWAGINAAPVEQRVRVTGERLMEGSGAPDQRTRLSRKPALPGSVRVFVQRGGGEKEEWRQIDDLANAAAEVPVRDPRLPPGAPERRPGDPRVFVMDEEAGEIRFGHGLRGARPPLGAVVTADFDYSEGREGNVPAGAIRTGATLPPGFRVTNPIATWGGADAETLEDGERQVQRWMQHRERLVTAEDFAMITWRTPGVEIGRVDVIPAFSPELDLNEPGDAAGAVTLMVVPRSDREQPDAPRPDRHFLDAICRWIDPRRLVTTEVFLRGPNYRRIWVTVGIQVASERSVAEVRQDVERALRAALAPLPPRGTEPGPDALLPVFSRESGSGGRGWPLRRGVVALELGGLAARVPGVTGVRGVLLAGESHATPQTSLEMRGLDLPRVAGILVSVGDPVSPLELRGVNGSGGPASGGGTASTGFVPVPVVPEEC
jgi:predicted phage baseplate assembly protein